jgi:hypothetical protein
MCAAAYLEQAEPVGCAWAWAHSHHVWCVIFQRCENWVYIVGARHWEFADPAECMREVEASQPYDIGCHVLPPSASEGVSGETLEEKFEESRLGYVHLCEDGELHAGIGMIRRLLPGVLFGTEPGVKEFSDALAEFRPGSVQSEEGTTPTAPRPVQDSGSVAAQAMMMVAEFVSSGEPLHREACALDWSARNMRRRLA